MSETRSTRVRGKAKARATASSAEPSGQQALTEAAVPAMAAQAKVKSGGKKQTKKAATPAVVAPVVALPPAPASPSPQKKKRRKRTHKRKNSGVDLDEGDGEDVPSEEMEQKAAKTKQDTAGATPSAKRKKKQADKEPESALPSAPKEAPAPAATRTRKRKNRSGSIGGHEEETGAAAQTDARQVSVVPTKQTKQAAAEQAAPRGRTTRATRAAAATAAAEPGDAKPVSASPSQEAVPVTASKSKKKRKTKATRSVSTDAPSEPTPEPESRTPHSHTVPVRKSARLAHEEITEEQPQQSAAEKPVRNIISLAKVKGRTPRRETAPLESTQPESHSEVVEEKPPTTSLVNAPQDEGGEGVLGEERTLTVTDVAVELEAPTDALQDGEQVTIAAVELTEVKNEEKLLRAEEMQDDHGRVGVETAVRDEQDDGLPLASFVGGLSYHSRPGSSVESVLGVGSYQADVLDSEIDEQEFGSPVASEREGTESQVGDVVAVQPVDVDHENEVEDAPYAEPASQGSIDGSEAFTLEQDDQGDEEEYESLGVSSQSAIRERETAVDLEDEGDLYGVDQETKDEQDDENIGPFSDNVPVDGGRNDTSVSRDRERELGDEGDLGELQDDDGASIPSTLPLSSLNEPDHANAQEDDGSSDEEVEQSAEKSFVDGGLNDSFVDGEEQEGDWTESDNEEGFASEADTAIIDELPGLRATSSNHAPAVDEVIILSDTDSDEDGDSTSPTGALTHDDDDVDAMELHDGVGDEAVDHSALNYEAGGDFALTTAVGESDRSAATSATSNLYDGGETVQASHEDGSVERSYPKMNKAEEEKREEPSDAELAQTSFTDGAAGDDVQDMAEGNEKQELADDDLSSSDRYESDRTIELYGDDDDESRHDAALMQGDGITEGSRAEATDEGVEEGIQHEVVQVEHTSTAPSEPTPSAPPDSSALPEEAAEAHATQSMVETEKAPTGSTADVIAYRTTPSKHLIDTVLSASREQALARITEAATTTPSQMSKRSTTEHSWGLSFGVSASPDALTTAADDGGPAIGSPLSSWFFSRGPANFKKRVLIPSPSSPRQRLGSPRPLKMMRVEAATSGHASSGDLFNQSGNTTDRFIQSLVDKSAWRSWYSKTKPEELLDAPLPVAMVKRLGGDAALALLTHPSVKPSSPFEEQVQGAVAVPKKRLRALAQLEASIQEEKKRTKAFDEELLQILQGKTLTGRDLADEFAPLLPPTSNR